MLIPSPSPISSPSQRETIVSRSLLWKRLACLTILSSLLLFGGVPPYTMADGPAGPAPLLTEKDYINGKLPTYLEWQATKGKSFSDAAALQARISVDASAYAAVSEETHFTKTDNGLLWKDGESWIDYQLTIPEDGLYNLGVVYESADDAVTDIIRGVYIDGELPFLEADNIRLKHKFVYQGYPLKRDEFGNDILPQSTIVKEQQDVRLADYTADITPLKWYLSKGVHTVRLVNQQSAMLLKSLYADSPLQIPAYAEVASDYQATARNGDFVQLVEAEQMSAKSNTSIQLQSVSDALISPDPEGLIHYNAMGGEQFRISGQWAEWEIEVPETGLYELGFKFKQAFLNNSYTNESIMIDGQTPFKEMLDVQFAYSKSWGWAGKSLADKQGKPFLFQLTKGKHTVRISPTAAPMKPIYEGLLRNLNRISALEQRIRKVTGNYERSYTSGGNVDLNRDWQLEKYIPDIEERLTEIEADLTGLADRLSGLTIGESDVESSFRAAAYEFNNMKSRIRQIPSELQLFATTQQKLSSWAFRMLDQPLMLDYLWVSQPGAELPQVAPNMWQKLGNTAVNFYRSFVIDYNFTRDDPKAIDVWVNRGRNYVRLIQQLADETFTPETGIHVNVNIVPDPNMLILGNLAGDQPDAALGVDGGVVGDFAMRGALADLTKMPGYNDAIQAFNPGAMRVFHYDGGNYALPETQNFKIMMYRTDILEQLGLKPPQTWEDVYTMLPTLQQSGHEFFYTPADYLSFLYQNGAELYSKDGLVSGLDTDAAFKGFKQWTQLFTLFQLPKEVPSFFNHFRLGDMPIGITDFNTYLLTQVAAPEIAGKWQIAPIPGNMDEKSGTVLRWAGGPLQAGIIYEKSEKQELAWKFLQWWTSEKTQVRFGNDIEAIYGPEYRWNSANMDAFAKLPWPRSQLSAILEQWKWYKEAPNVPGGYFTARQLVFAWQNVVAANAVPREELDKAIIAINQEMARKQVEFKMRDSVGKVLHPIDIPDVPSPGKGEEP
ncbi:extracellular solute-binding protein [Paenibacillus sp. BC26]|uniref:extracellular solute-binding protein n=1 Tax=Paenibacillus sp. BC26 TaxID=1881032 RepID=UPI0008F42014|nr:extracellular solute-binding protein [Paenibacillus sp. BC26]SFT00204.1 ABC-type glycerol-3-phosphate transport system, substrate-binding protein [Paenibacillus sp. BC26]